MHTGLSSLRKREMLHAAGDHDQDRVKSRLAGLNTSSVYFGKAQNTSPGIGRWKKACYRP